MWCMRCRPLSSLAVLGLAVLSLALLLAAPAGAARFYVNRNAGGTAHDGSTWSTAFLHVQDAINAGGAQGAEIWAAAGTYQERMTVPSSTYGFQLYGGFTGTETDRTQRDPTANVTTLQDTHSGTVVTFQPGVYSTTVLDGFTITGGIGTTVVNSSGNTDIYGAGILCLAASSPVIRNNTIVSNSAWVASPGVSYGAGISVMGGSPQIDGNVIKQNNAQVGAGIYCATKTYARITNNTLDGNGSYGIVACLGTTISGNRVLNSSGGYGIYIAATAPADVNAPATVIERNEVSKNLGGGITYYGTTPDKIGTPFITIRNNLIRLNTSNVGPAMCLRDLYGRVINNTIVSNTETDPYNNYGSIYIYNETGTGAPILSNNIIAHNTSGIYDATVSGIHPYVQFNCFFDNTADNGWDYKFSNPGTDPTQSNNNIKVDPGFCNHSTYTYPNTYDYRLVAASPCVDVGEDVTSTGSNDLDGEPRKDGAHTDMGAYEMVHGLTMAFVVQPTDTLVQQTITPSPAVTVLRPNGQVYPHATRASMVLKPGTGGAGASLSGHSGNEASFVNGVATFDGLYMFQAGLGNVLQASWGGLTAESQPFNEMLTVRYVGMDGNDSNDGATRSNAKRTIQAALDPVLAPGGEVRVSQGTYTGPFTLRAGVKLLGGYADPPYVDWRDTKQYLTVLDGNQAGATVMVASGAGTETLLDGFTVTNGTGRRINIIGSLPFWKGGGIYAYNASPTIHGNHITGNSATLGGGIYADAGSPVITGNVIDGNTVTATTDYVGEGGGLYLNNAPATVHGNLFRANSAVGTGSTLRAVSIGAAVSCHGSSAIFRENTIAGNTAPPRSNSFAIVSSTPRFTNNIIALNTGGVYASSDSEIIATFNDLYGNGLNYSGPGTPFENRGDISMDPLFVNLSGGDCHPAGDSACINAGENRAVPDGDVDLDGVPRPQDGIVDMGAYERRVLNVVSARFVDATHVSLNYSDAINADPTKGALIPQNYAVEDLDNGGALFAVTEVRRDNTDSTLVSLAFASLPYGHHVRITVSDVKSVAGVLVNPLKDTATVLLPVQVIFHMTDNLGLHLNKTLSVVGDFSGWVTGQFRELTLADKYGTFEATSNPVWILPGRMEYRYYLNWVDANTMNQVNRVYTVLPVSPQTINDVTGVDVKTTFNLTVYADKAFPAGKDVYVTGGFCNWSATPGASPGPVKLAPGSYGRFTATATIKQMTWAYRYILIDRTTGSVDNTTLNAQDRGTDMHPTGNPLAWIINDTAGTPSRTEIAARILRITAGLEGAPTPAADPAFTALDLDGNGRIEKADAVKGLKNG